ncbi:RagB/SusD family nutrient uptake outer membrane protein [Flavobacterium pectinovorum]|uniref:RagB/SusD family nutrient uptake outer membrane protein n=1 Tax=Flavobacterium pectinovorum TaxID=29533 RepID=UPI001FAE3E1E|nr:RagB/SusD family nutrient uptake outer membrane protein [Flavobacterium pectinovorum]
MNYYKNIKQFKFLTLLAMLFLFQSCSDFLEQEPGTQTSIDEQLETKKGVLQALNGMYGDIRDIVNGQAYLVYSDIQGGNLKLTPSLIGNQKGGFRIHSDITNFYSFDDSADKSNFSAFYGYAYEAINEANLILEFTDALTDATESEKNQIKAEALTARAYVHFLLNQLYSQNYSYTNDASHPGIVYNTKSVKNGLQYPSRETAANTYNYIINDIKKALDLYSNSTLLNGPAYSYFNKTNAKALLSRVYLSKNDWNNAYETANDVITNSGINLISSDNLIAQWAQPDLPVSEILLEFSISRTTEGVASNSLSAYFGYTSSTAYSDYVASEDLINLYETSDIRKQLFLVEPLQTLVNLQLVDRNYYFTKKFQGNPGYVAFRMSEQYLIRAEAALKLNNTVQAKTDINTIRERANASLLTDSENLEDAIFLERRKELCFEGHLFFDTTRNHKNISRNDGCQSLNCSMNYPSLKFVLPIPRNNTNINANLKQNESY